jgi:hypothetical protein
MEQQRGGVDGTAGRYDDFSGNFFMVAVGYNDLLISSPERFF